MNNTELIGNRKNLELLSRAKSLGKLSHAYIINGEAGSGKKTFADFIAKGLLCDAVNIDGTRSLIDGACGKCPACIKSNSLNHPDIIRLVHEKPGLVGVNEVREQLVDSISVKPYYGPYKIYIVNDAHLMNEPAQNAILKTIEEPPSYGLIMLLTDNADMLLDTIRSRCIRLDMEKLGRDRLKDILKTRKSMAEREAMAAAAFSGGNMGKAMVLTGDSTESELIREITELLTDIGTMSATEIFAKSVLFNKGKAYSAYTGEALTILKKWYRDVAVVKSGAADSGLYFEGEPSKLKVHARALTFEALNTIFNAIDTAAERLEYNVKGEAAFESLFLTVRDCYGEM